MGQALERAANGEMLTHTEVKKMITAHTRQGKCSDRTGEHDEQVPDSSGECRVITCIDRNQVRGTTFFESSKGKLSDD
jgi:hypothetical protein